MPTLSPFKNKLLAAITLFVALFLGSSSATPLNAQSPKIASFLKLKDLARLDSLEMHFIWAIQEPDSASMAADLNAIELYANQSQDKELRIFNNYLILRYFTFKPVPKPSSRYLEMKKLLGELDKLPQTLLTDRIRAYIEFRMGMILYDDRANSVTLVNHFLTGDLLFRKVGYDNVLLADHKLNRLGTYYMNQVSDFKTAIKYFREGEKYLAKDPIDHYRIEFYKNYANCLVYLKQYEQAIKYNKLAIAQVRLRRDSLKIGTINGNIGEIILNTYPNPAQSEPYFKQELVYRLRYKPKGLGDIAKVYGNLCQVAGVKGNKQEVVQNFEKAVKILKSDPDTLDYHALLSGLYKNRMIADSLIGDFKSAFLHRKGYYEELIVSNEQEIKAITSEASVRFDVEKNKLQAELANEQAQNARFWILAVSLALAIVLFGAYFVYYRQKTRREELMRRLSFEQKEAERLMALDETKTRFFTNISHEFRTPLTLLVGPLAELGKKYPTEGMIPIMQRNLSRLQNLINQLLDLSKLEVGKLEPIIQYGDVAHFFRYQFASFESLAQSKQIIFERTQSHQKHLAYFDEDKLEKIVTNLLSNAFKFTNENGRVKVNVQYTASEGEGNEKGELLTLTVSDNGIGIDAERLPRIFDRFYQIDDSQRRHYEGTGIGLALVKELVLALKGTIDVTSKPEKGTTFVVTLPCDAAHWGEFVHASQTTVEKLGTPTSFESSVSSSIEAPVVDKNSEAPLLLIVEDNPDLRHYIRSIFSSTYRIEEAQDGQIGLQMATELIPDVVICDVMMPRLDGFGFCKALKTDIRTNHIPVVMLTAKATLNDRLEGLETGADDYLSKPFHTEELQLRIQNLLKKQQLLQQKYAHLAPITQVADEVVPVASMDDLFLQKATEVLAKNYTESSFDVDQFAAEMGLTSVQLRRKLKALTNQTVTEYVRNYRLQLAADMLRAKAGTVSEIAYKVGFESLPYFSKIFSERYGILPSEYV